jgi:hypothetical protein
MNFKIMNEFIIPCLQDRTPFTVNEKEEEEKTIIEGGN